MKPRFHGLFPFVPWYNYQLFTLFSLSSFLIFFASVFSDPSFFLLSIIAAEWVYRYGYRYHNIDCLSLTTFLLLMMFFIQ